MSMDALFVAEASKGDGAPAVSAAARARAALAARYHLDVIAGLEPPVETWPRHRTDCKSFKACSAALPSNGHWRCPPPAPYFAGCPDLDVDELAEAPPLVAEAVRPPTPEERREDLQQTRREALGKWRAENPEKLRAQGARRRSRGKAERAKSAEQAAPVAAQVIALG
jgi:hypothetical protein